MLGGVAVSLLEDVNDNHEIPVVTGITRKSKPRITQSRQSTLITVETSGLVCGANALAVQKDCQSRSAISQPSLYVLNAAALTKPHAVQHLTTDLTSYDIDVAIITETHCKSKHSDSVLSVDGYVMYRRDRAGRRGGGVALYVRTSIASAEWKHPGDDNAFELHWVRVGEVFIAALYHPPKPIYRTEALLDYIEACVDELNRRFPTAPIVIAGDLNQLPDEDLVERTGLTQIVRQLTRGANVLDRVFVSCPVSTVQHCSSRDVSRKERPSGRRGVR